MQLYLFGQQVYNIKLNNMSGKGLILLALLIGAMFYSSKHMTIL